MGVEHAEADMAVAALGEYLVLAERGLSQGQEVLGYATAALLFAFVDALGSYHRGGPLTVTVDGGAVSITSLEHHVRILNAPYFDLKLSGECLRRIYRTCRSPLTHNGLVGVGIALFPGGEGGLAVEPVNGLLFVRLRELLAACTNALAAFRAESHQLIPQSVAIRELRELEAPYERQLIKAIAAVKQLGPFESLQASALAPSSQQLRWRPT